MHSEPGASVDVISLKLDFNLFPSDYAHPSWLAQLGIHATQLSTPFARAPLWKRSVSTALLRAHRLEQYFDCDFADHAKRLALIDAATLIRIGGLVLATLLRERLRRIVQRSQVQALHDCMGVEAHQFALRWNGPVPALPLPFEESPASMTAESWAQRSIGQVFATLPEQASGVSERMRLRFPTHWTLPDPGLPKLGDAQRGDLTKFVVAIIGQSAAQWSWLFSEPSTPAAPAATAGRT
jgi:hypothetical protein